MIRKGSFYVDDLGLTKGGHDMLIVFLEKFNAATKKGQPRKYACFMGYSSADIKKRLGLDMSEDDMDGFCIELLQAGLITGDPCGGFVRNVTLSAKGIYEAERRTRSIYAKGLGAVCSWVRRRLNA
jgi:hypothetical protein